MRVDQPVLATLCQNILLEGMYVAIFLLDVLGVNISKRQFNTSAA